MWKKKTDLEEAKRIVQEAEEQKKAAAEQNKPTPIVQTNTEAPALPVELEEQIKYYSKYRGLFNPQELAPIAPMQAEALSLLFAILQELREIKQAIKE